MIKLSKQQIKDIADELDMNNKCYYHFPTGKVVTYFDDDEGVLDEETSEEIEQIKADIEEHEENYFEFTKMSSRDSFSTMVDFIDFVSNKYLAEQLTDALSQSKPFRRFKQIVENSMYRDTWFRFRDERSVAWVERKIKDFNEQVN